MSTTNSSTVTMTVTETANVLGISRSSAYECVRLGAIPSIRLGRRIVVPTSSRRGTPRDGVRPWPGAYQLSNAAAASAASLCWPGITWPYVSSVKLTDA